jgi:3-dehydroquinate dehydratase/shikimate dehydrogenase
MARQKGLAVISGVEMFVQQGARQFEIWTGKPAPEEEMLRVVLHSLKQSGEAASAETNVGAAATRIDVGPRAPGSHADFEPAATSQPPVVTGTGKPAAKQVKPAVKAAAKPAANHQPVSTKAATNGKTAGNGKNAAAVKTNVKAKVAAKPAAKAASNHKPAAKAPAKKSAKAAPAKAKRKG